MEIVGRIVTGCVALLLVFGLFLSISFTLSEWSRTNAHYSLIAKCEQTLPRNQRCVLIAVPEVK